MIPGVFLQANPLLPRCHQQPGLGPFLRPRGRRLLGLRQHIICQAPSDQRLQPGVADLAGSHGWLTQDAQEAVDQMLREVLTHDVSMLVSIKVVDDGDWSLMVWLIRVVGKLLILLSQFSGWLTHELTMLSND